MRKFALNIQPAMLYLSRTANILIELILLLLISCIICAAVLYVGDMFWHLYLETPMGRQFFISFPEQAREIQEILSFKVLMFSLDITITTFLICMAAGSISRFFHISRHFFLSLGFFSKLFFWGIPLAAAVTFYINRLYGMTNPLITGVAVIPSFCLLISCFKSIDHLVPEFGDVFRLGAMHIRRGWAVINERKAPDYDDSSFTYNRFQDKIASYKDKSGH